MKKTILVPLFVLFLMTAGCSGNRSTVTPEATPVQSESVEHVQRPTRAPTEPVNASSLPTATEALAEATATAEPLQNPTESVATEPMPTETVAAQCPQFGSEDFDQPSECWSETNVVSLTNIIKADKISTKVADGMLQFKIDTNEELYLYLFDEEHAYKNVIVEADIFKLSPSVNQTSSIYTCNVNEEGWYEARVENSGIYKIYQYIRSRKEDGLNPFVFIAEGGSNEFRIGDSRPNNIRWECRQNQLKLVINGKETWVKDYPTDLPGGGVGIGVTSYANRFPLIIGFDKLTILEP